DKTAALQGAGIPGEYASAISANITKDKRIVLRHRRTPGYNHTTKELELAFTRHMMKDITTETLPETNISFGDQLQLRDGDLVQTTRKWRKTIETVIPFGSIYRMSDSAPITLDGHPNVKGKSETLVNLGDTGHNIEVLRQIIKLGSVPTT
ncbi:MAG: hypothetical protein FWE42_01875, partial [Defluviitaleaceae bacterium]|nr:hypothetical protein [Defluviitaleaceae bacterium]